MPSDVSTLHLHLHPSIEYLPSLPFPAPAGQMSHRRPAFKAEQCSMMNLTPHLSSALPLQLSAARDCQMRVKRSRVPRPPASHQQTLRSSSFGLSGRSSELNPRLCENKALKARSNDL